MTFELPYRFCRPYIDHGTTAFHFLLLPFIPFSFSFGVFVVQFIVFVLLLLVRLFVESTSLFCLLFLVLVIIAFDFYTTQFCM